MVGLKRSARAQPWRGRREEQRWSWQASMGSTHGRGREHGWSWRASMGLDPRDEQARRDQDREGDEEQDAAEREQRVELKADRLVELVGDARRDRGARIEDR